MHLGFVYSGVLLLLVKLNCLKTDWIIFIMLVTWGKGSPFQNKKFTLAQIK